MTRDNITREMIDEYLDGVLEAARRQEIQGAIAQDADASALLAQMKSERAARNVAFNSYMPTRQESNALADNVLMLCAEEADAPLAAIGPHSSRRWMGVAAGLAIMGGVFMLGRTTAPQGQPIADTRTVYVVHYQANGVMQTSEELASVEARDAFLDYLNEQPGTRVIAVDSGSGVQEFSGRRKGGM